MWRTEAAAKPPKAPRRPLVTVGLPKILLLVGRPVFLLPFLQGLSTWLAKYWVPAPRAAPQAAESMAWFPVKNRVFGLFLFKATFCERLWPPRFPKLTV